MPVFRPTLRIAGHCATVGGRGYTPSDFRKVRLSQADLDDIFAAFDDAEEPAAHG